MIKKSFIIISIFFFIAVISTNVFATNIVEGTENTLGNIKNGVQNMITGAGNAMEHAGSGISNMLNDGRESLYNMGGGVKNVVNDMSDDNSANSDMDTQDSYTATRTSTTTNANTTGGTNTALIWTVLAITGLIIIALVWFYGAQRKNDNDNY